MHDAWTKMVLKGMEPSWEAAPLHSEKAGAEWDIEKPLPRSAIIPKVETLIQKHGLEEFAQHYLEREYGIESLEELLSNSGVYEVAESLEKLIEKMVR